MSQRLSEGAAQLGLQLTAAQHTQLLAYLALIQKWNKVYNLTAITQPEQMLTHHLLDALSIIAPLQKHLADQGLMHPSLVDVGSGAGLPGVVIGICLPHVRVVCVDVVGKKTAFIQQTAGELGLKNVSAHHGRVEEMDLSRALAGMASTKPAGADLFTCRAFAKLSDFAESTQHLSHPGSTWLAMKAQTVEVEVGLLPGWIQVFHVEHLDVPFLGAQREVVWMRHTPQ